MNAETFFREMFHNIWQSHDISRIGDYYAQNFEESIQTWDEAQQRPVESGMDYLYMVEQAALHKENEKDTTLDIKKVVAGENQHISVNFYSSSVNRKTGKTRYRYVCGIWRLNAENKIDRVWAVVTPHGAL